MRSSAQLNVLLSHLRQLRVPQSRLNCELK